MYNVYFYILLFDRVYITRVYELIVSEKGEGW